MSEDNLQSECFKYFHNSHCLRNNNPRLCMFSVPNGGTRNIIEAKKLKATGLIAGVADTIILFPNAFTLFVEFKTTTGVQSDKQKEFEATVNALGFRYTIIRSIDQFKQLIGEYI